jgi:Arc/MetJ family transcription regulator
MQTTLDIEPDLLNEVMEITGEHDKARAVTKALREYLRRRRIAELREVAENVDLANDLGELEALELKEMEQIRERYSALGNDSKQ